MGLRRSLPAVIANQNGVFPYESRHRKVLASTGWYIYGAKDSAGMFVVQAIAPRALLRLQPDAVILAKRQR